MRLILTTFQVIIVNYYFLLFCYFLSVFVVCLMSVRRRLQHFIHYIPQPNIRVVVRYIIIIQIL